MIHKLLPASCCGLIAITGLSFAQETAHLTGPVSTGQPPPAPPLAKLVIAPQDVLDSKSTDLGDRRITIQKVAPIELPAPAEAAAVPAISAEQRTAFIARRQQAKPRVLLMMAVTIVHSESYSGDKFRTRIRWSSDDHTRQFEVISNIDGNWLGGGFSEFETATNHYSLFCSPGNEDVDRLSALMASKGRAYQPPAIPEALPQGDPAFVVTEGAPTAEELAPIQAVHDLFKSQGETLRLAYEARKQASQQRDAEAKANPPKPKDIVLHYWRMPKADTATPVQGGAR